MHLILADETQKRERDQATYAAWGQCLDMNGFLLRELRLRQHPWARETMATWLLCSDEGAILSSCETFKMTSYRGSPEPSSERIKGFTYGIASVFTEPKHRGNRYATALIDRVLVRIAQEDPKAHASILFSDVPPATYERSGYVLRPAFQRVFAAEPGDPAKGVDRLLQEADIAAVFAALSMPQDPFLVWPTVAQVDWHLERERVYSELLHRPRPQAWGAVLGAATALWSADLKHGHLNVLMLQMAGASELRALIGAACRTAQAAGLSSVHWWHDPVDEDAVPPSFGKIEDRQSECESLPMIRAFDARIQAAQWIHIPKAIWM